MRKATRVSVCQGSCVLTKFAQSLDSHQALVLVAHVKPISDQTDVLSDKTGFYAVNVKKLAQSFECGFVSFFYQSSDGIYIRRGLCVTKRVSGRSQPRVVVCL